MSALAFWRRGPNLFDLAVRPATDNGIEIRAARPDDKARIVSAFSALPPRSIYQRFFFPKRNLSERDLEWVTGPDGDRNVVLVATVRTGGQEAIIAVGQYARRGAKAEVAFTVAEGFRGRGIAGRLLRQLVDIARRSGVQYLEADVLIDNTAMLRVFRRCGLPVRESAEDGVVQVTISLDPRVTPTQAA